MQQNATQKPLRNIQILPAHVVNRIAAGEVVERPASVVKELVENALDAGATRIDIFAGAGGRSLRIADNGSGMAPENARLAFYNHATSKIETEADLDRIETLGFRGEALASIASVSRVTCLTRTKNTASGTKVTLDALGEPQLQETGCSEGTVMEVTDLFYNTPARLKFLKRPQTELGHVEEIVQSLALSHPEVRFSLTLGEKETLKTSGSGNLELLLEEIFNLKREHLTLISFRASDPETGYAITGYMSSPEVMKSSKKWIIPFVNGRSVRCPIAVKAIETAYESLIPHGKYPFCVLFLSLPNDEVDVNVHPTKKEVRYVRANSVFSFIRQNLLNTLIEHGHDVFARPFGPGHGGANSTGGQYDSRSDVFPGGGFSGASGMGWHGNRAPGFGPSGPSGLGSFGGPAAFSGSQEFSGYASRPVPSLSPGESRAALEFYEPQTLPLSAQAGASGSDGPDGRNRLKIIGQLFNTYILLETPQGLMVVDQHIASERAFFEALTRNTLAESPAVQQLLTSKPMTLSPSQSKLLAENSGAFEKLGFTFTISDVDTLTLTSVPLIYQDRQDPYPLFETLLTQLEEHRELKLDVDNLIATLACHSAVRAGDTLTHHQMALVIEHWLACELPWTCPHGRPIAHTIRTEDLNRFFHRPSLPVNASANVETGSGDGTARFIR